MEKKEELKNEIVSSSLTFIIACTLFIICDIFFKLVTWQEYTAFSHSYAFSVFFGIVIYTLVLAVTKKTSRATVICYVSIFIISIINQIKVFFTSEPLYFSDINFLGKSSDLVKLVSQNISFNQVFGFLLICGIYGLILIIISLFSFKYNVEIKSKKMRWGIIVIDVIILVLLFFPNAYTKNLYLKVFFNTDEYVDYNSYVSNISFYQRNGFINGMYGTFLNNIFVEPENYDENTLNKMLDEAEPINTEKLGKPNIIVVFSESFWDIDQLTEVEFDKPITSNFNKLKNEGEFINLISPTYGGMSENVAFEFVTGGSMNYFPVGYIPIMSLYSRKNSENIPSLTKVLNNNGYYSEIVFGKDDYNSEEAYSKIGFNDYTEIVVPGYSWVSDEFCTDLLIKELENKKSDEPLFYLLETIESHMPFYTDKYSEYDISIVKSELSNSANGTLRIYAQGIYNADQQLGRLYEYIKAYDEPTILVFLGDHLPYIYNEDMDNIIFELDYFNTEDSLVNDFRLYNTQALVLSNFEMNNVDFPEYMGVDLLFNYLVNNLDVEIEPYYKWLYTTTDVLSGANRYVSFDENGNLYETSSLKDEMKEVFENRNLMQYKFFINSK